MRARKVKPSTNSLMMRKISQAGLSSNSNRSLVRASGGGVPLISLNGCSLSPRARRLGGSHPHASRAAMTSWHASRRRRSTCPSTYPPLWPEMCVQCLDRSCLCTKCARQSVHQMGMLRQRVCDACTGATHALADTLLYNVSAASKEWDYVTHCRTNDDNYVCAAWAPFTSAPALHTRCSGLERPPVTKHPRILA